MMEQHKQMIRDLMHGKLDLDNAPHEATYTSSPASSVPAPAAPTPAPAEEKPSPPSPTPSREDVKEKGLDDVILDFLSQEQQDREQKKSF
jgi:hypothetical protein